MAKKILITNLAVPVTDNQNSLTAVLRGPVLILDVHIREKQEMMV